MEERTLLRSSDVLQAKKLIPDFGTWVQCFMLYSAVIIQAQPHRAHSLLSYAATIAKLSLKYKWPSWAVYDNAYRQQAADNGCTDWAKEDGILHVQCFAGMALRQEAWCSLCHSLDHLLDSCPLRPASSRLTLPDPKKSHLSKELPPIC